MDKEITPEEKAGEQYTANVLQNGFSRRSFLSRAVVGTAGVGAMVLSGMGGTGKKAEAAEPARCTAYAKSSDGGATLEFMPKPEVIAEKDISATKTFDVLVVGAGASGVPAALSAAENGAKVAVIQKHPTIVSQGNTGSGIDLATSDKAGVEALVSLLNNDNNHRCKPGSAQILGLQFGRGRKMGHRPGPKGGATVVDQGSGPQFAIRNVKRLYAQLCHLLFRAEALYHWRWHARTGKYGGQSRGAVLLQYASQSAGGRIVAGRLSVSLPKAGMVSTSSSWLRKGSSWRLAITRTTKRCVTFSSPT